MPETPHPPTTTLLRQIYALIDQLPEENRHEVADYARTGEITGSVLMETGQRLLDAQFPNRPATDMPDNGKQSAPNSQSFVYRSSRASVVPQVRLQNNGGRPGVIISPGPSAPARADTTSNPSGCGDIV